MTRFDTGCACCRDDFYDYEEWLTQRVSLVEHPLAQHALTAMRDRAAPAAAFRDCLRAAGAALVHEALREVEPDIAETESGGVGVLGPTLAKKNVALAALSSAGRFVVEGAAVAAPFARVVAADGSSLADNLVVALDAGLASGDEAVAAIAALKERGAVDLRFGCVVASAEGVEKLRCGHPEIPLWMAAIDSHLDVAGNIVPGVGDMAARLAETA